MGTLKDWMWVLALAVGWAVSMEMTAPFTPQEFPLRLRLWSYLDSVAAGIFFGMGITFHWRMFRGGLLVVLLLLAVFVIVSSAALRRAARGIVP